MKIEEEEFYLGGLVFNQRVLVRDRLAESQEMRQWVVSNLQGPYLFELYNRDKVLYFYFKQPEDATSFYLKFA